MRTLLSFESLPCLAVPVVTMGSFDGVHIGHRAVLSTLRQIARTVGGRSVVVTFAPHPRVVIGNMGESVELLNTFEEKQMLLAAAGIDDLIVTPFTREFSRMPADEFVIGCLAQKVGVKKLVVGFDHNFGRDHAGDLETLRDLGRRYGFDVVEVPKQDMATCKISSTAIRRLVRAGEMREAAKLLGYSYFVALYGGAQPRTGEPEKLLPPAGRYAVGIYEAGCMPCPESFIANGEMILAGGSRTVEVIPDACSGIVGLPDAYIAVFMGD